VIKLQRALALTLSCERIAVHLQVAEVPRLEIEKAGDGQCVSDRVIPRGNVSCPLIETAGLMDKRRPERSGVSARTQIQICSSGSNLFHQRPHSSENTRLRLSP
jgi:hypothetical protein